MPPLDEFKTIEEVMDGLKKMGHKEWTDKVSRSMRGALGGLLMADLAKWGILSIQEKLILQQAQSVSTTTMTQVYLKDRCITWATFKCAGQGTLKWDGRKFDIGDIFDEGVKHARQELDEIRFDRIRRELQARPLGRVWIKLLVRLIENVESVVEDSTLCTGVDEECYDRVIVERWKRPCEKKERPPTHG